MKETQTNITQTQHINSFLNILRTLYAVFILFSFILPFSLLQCKYMEFSLVIIIRHVKI